MPLAVAVTGDISAFAKAMAAASTVAAKAAQGIAEDFITSKLKIDKAFSGSNLAKLGAGLAIGAAVFASWKALSVSIEQASKEMERLLALEATARKAGVSSDFAKGFTEATRETRVETDALARSLASAGEATRTTFSKLSTVGEFLKKVYGDVHERVLAFEAASPEQKIIQAVSAMRDLLSTGNQLAAIDLAETMGMKELAENMRSGRANLEAFQATLVQAAGKQADQARHATELNDRLDDANAKIKEFLGVSFSLVDLGFRLKETWVGIVETIANATDKVRALQAAARTATGVTPEVAAALGIKPEAKTIYDQPAGPDITPEMRAQNALRLSLGSQAARDAAAKKSEAMTEGFFDKKKAAPAAAAAAAEQHTALERFVEQQKKSNAEAQTQAELVGASNLEYKIALALAQARVAAEKDFTDKKREQKGLTEAEIANITHLAQVQEKARESVRQTIALQQFAGQTLVSALDKATDSGAKLGDVMLDVAKAIKTAAIQALIMGQGPLAGLFGTGGGQTGQAGPGSLIGLISAGFKAIPKYAEGGVVPGSGPQLAMVHGGETIIPRGASSGGPIQINQTIDARGAQLGVADQIAAALSANNRALQTNLPAMIRSAQSRGAIR